MRPPYENALAEVELALDDASAAGWMFARVRDPRSPTGYSLTPTTVWGTLTELQDGIMRLRELDAHLAGAGAYAGGPRIDLERAFDTLLTELVAQVERWAQPPRDDLRERGEDARANREEVDA